MDRAIRFVSWLLLLGLGAGVLSLVIPFCCVLGFALDDREYQRVRALESRGEALKQAGDWNGARAVYRQARALRPSVYQLLDIARCTAELGDYEAALQLYDQAIVEGGVWYEPYNHQARCIQRHEGTAAAVAWFESLERQEGRPEKYQYLIGSLHMESGRPREAIPYFERVLAIEMPRLRVTFDAVDELAPIARVDALSWDELATLWPHPTDLATCHLRASQLDEAYTWATRGVSLHRHINDRKGYCSPEQIVAGDTECRMVRARVHMARQEWDHAEREIERASAFLDGWSESKVRELRLELAAARGR